MKALRPSLGAVLAVSTLLAACGEPQAPSDCAAGEHFDETTASCLADEAAAPCPEDEVLDPTTGACGPIDYARHRTSAGVTQHIGAFDVEFGALPETLHEGFDTPITLRITNTGSTERGVTQLRLLAATATSATVDRYLRAAADKTLCENTGNWTWDSCDVPFRHETCSPYLGCPQGVPTPPGTDCGDCRPDDKAIDPCIQAWHPLPGARQRVNTCDAPGFQCDATTSNCHPALVPLADAFLENLPAGETQEISVPLHLPAGLRDVQGNPLRDTTLQVLLAINEERLIAPLSNTERPHHGSQPQSAVPVPHREYALDPNNPIDPRKSSLQNAEAVSRLGETHVSAAGGFEVGLVSVGVESREEGGVGGVRMSNFAFELDTSARQEAPAFHVRLRIESRGTAAGEVPVHFRLKLPGHVGAMGWENEAAPVFHYDADRRLDLDVEGTAPGESRPSSPVAGRLPRDAVRGGGAQTDVDYVLRLSRLDTKLLSDTLRQRALYPAEIISGHDEIAGQLEIELVPGAETDPVGDATANNRAVVDVVFMVPPEPRDALLTDPDDPAANYVPAGADALGPYEEIDHFTPTLYDRMGGEWLGAAYQIKNLGSKERKHGAIVKQRVEADDFVKSWFLLQEYTFLGLSGHGDFGSQRLADQNSAALSATLMNDKLVDLEWSPDETCEDEDNVTTCTLFSLNGRDDEDEPPPLVELDPEVAGEAPSTTKEWTYEFEEEICYKKLICLVGQLEATATVGLRGAVQFVRDASFANTGRIRTSVEAGFGPFVSLDGMAFGGVHINIARAGIEGEINFLDADFIPTLEASLTQREATPDEQDIYNGGQPCWMENEGELAFIGKASLETLSGTVSAVFYAGMNKCVFGLCFNFEFEVWRFMLAAWDAVFSREWRLWDEAVAVRGEGLCRTAPHPDHAWSSPKGCQTPLGADAYCSSSDSLLNKRAALPDPREPRADAPPFPPADEPVVEVGWNTSPYGHRFYMGPSGCAQLEVDGDIQLGGDSLDVVGVYENSRLNRTNDAHLGVARQEDCRQSPLVLRGTVDERREPLDRPLDCRWDAAGSAPGVPARMRVAGDFDRQVLNVCDPVHRFGAVDLFLHTDATGVQRGVEVTINRLDPPDDAVYSDETWRGIDNAGSAGWHLLGQSTETFEVPGVQCCDTGPDFEVWPAQERRTRIKALTSPGRSIQTQYEDRTVAFRRPFLPTGDRYKVLLMCDDHCTLWLDGDGPTDGYVAHADFGRYAYLELGSPYIKKGRMQMLGLHLHNDGGPGAVYVALKKVPE